MSQHLEVANGGTAKRRKISAVLYVADVQNHSPPGDLNLYPEVQPPLSLGYSTGSPALWEEPRPGSAATRYDDSFPPGASIFGPSWGFPAVSSAEQFNLQAFHLNHSSEPVFATSATGTSFPASSGFSASQVSELTAKPLGERADESLAGIRDSSHYPGDTQSRAAQILQPGTYISSNDQMESLSSPVGKAPSPRQPSKPRRRVVASPFKECVGKFGMQEGRLSFPRPVDGQVNGYIKFNWPRQRPKRQSTSSTPTFEHARVTELDDGNSERTETSSPASTPDKLATTRVQSATQTCTNSPAATFGVLDSVSCPACTACGHCGHYRLSGETQLDTPPRSSTDVVRLGSPQRVPSHYGLDVKMDATDGKFWEFYVNNWCPGRSVLRGTNLWLRDFAQMHKADGVRAAIQSLAGIYIYDYQPLEMIRTRVNQRYAEAETRFTRLLNDPSTSENGDKANELVTIAAILSMQDIVLTERRRKKLTPRWLQGFQQGERFLQETDSGARFWDATNVQLSSLRNSLSVIVGRAVILAQPMDVLPPPDHFDAESAAKRFGWLLYGTEQDMYQIHGGCGFSKKLLHTLSQVTYCAARLQQDPESPIVPMTAKYLLTELKSMRQWSPESKQWDDVKLQAPAIDWIRRLPRGYKITSSDEMTDVTAESWRLAAILYLQARLLRFPRNDADVIATLDDLATCITIMPTSGSTFTAQAPLFPVFLLGLLSTLPKHRAVSSDWFNDVLRTPVRSSVPPLFVVLEKVWTWIDEDIPCPEKPGDELKLPISQRWAWWEDLVSRVQHHEQEVLCLT